MHCLGVVVEVMCVAFSWFIVVVCVVWGWISKWVCIVWTNAVCVLKFFGRGLRGLFRRRPVGARKIKHVFVLILENRSFDHMLGFSRLAGTDAVSGLPTVADDLRNGFSNPDDIGNAVASMAGADFALSATDQGPPHEFDNALHQLAGPDALYPDPVTGSYPALTNQGFVLDYIASGSPSKRKVMDSYRPDQLRVLNALAGEFALCDRWFSSLPGPTWPNRFFAHAASSGGLDDSPSSAGVAISTLLEGYRFWNGTIFDRLESACLPWEVIEGDVFPVTFAVSGMTEYAIEGHFRDYEDFGPAVASKDYAPRYTFIEPNYGNVLPTTSEDFTCGNSQHPLDDVTRGEQLIKEVYEAIRNSPHWESSLLIVTWDEHGGFADHVKPPTAAAPGDPISDPANDHHHFDFRQLGARVPAVVVSPWIARGLIDHTDYDHASIPATVERLFGFSAMTKRDAKANDVLHLLSLLAPRTDAPTALPDPAESGFSCSSDPAVERAAAEASSPLDATPDDWHAVGPHVRGFLFVALRKRLYMLPRDDLAGRRQLVQVYQHIRTDAQARQFIHQTRLQLRALRASTKSVQILKPRRGVTG